MAQWLAINQGMKGRYSHSLQATILYWGKRKMALFGQMAITPSVVSNADGLLRRCDDIFIWGRGNDFFIRHRWQHFGWRVGETS